MELVIAKDQGHGCRRGDSQRHHGLQGPSRARGIGGRLRDPGERAHIARDILAQQRILEPGAERGIGTYGSQDGVQLGGDGQTRVARCLLALVLLALFAVEQPIDRLT
jgi:hypothetical protein